MLAEALVSVLGWKTSIPGEMRGGVNERMSQYIENKVAYTMVMKTSTQLQENWNDGEMVLQIICTGII